jgi:hypothetical protein
LQNHHLFTGTILVKSSSVLSAACLMALVVGCSSSSGPAVAPADGEVLYMGKPVAGASVIFVPEKGAVAFGTTDTNGKFRLATGTFRGGLIGAHKVAISVSAPGPDSAGGALPPPPKTPAEQEAYMKKLNELQQMSTTPVAAAPKPVSPIPEKYAKTETSGLSYTIKPGNDNHFKIELQ